MKQSKAENLIGKTVLVIIDGDKDVKGEFLGADELFIYIRTYQNEVSIPLKRVIKLKSFRSEKRGGIVGHD